MAPIEAFINHVLEGSPAARARLGAHAGKTVQVDAPPLRLLLRVTGAGGVETASADAVADVSFRISASQVPLMLVDPERALQSVQLAGDAELAQVVAALARELRWDVEEDLSHWVGDVAAHRVGGAARAFLGWGRDAARRIAEDTTAFLTVEDPLLIRTDDLTSLAGAVAEVRDGVARLEKRLERLEASRAGAA